MDLKANIEQLNEQINLLETNILTLKDQLKKAKQRRAAFVKLEDKAKAIIA